MPRPKSKTRVSPRPSAPSAVEPDLDHIAEKLRPFAFPIAELLPDPENARKHGEDNLRAIMASLREHGQVGLILANSRNHQVVIGNGRFEAARRLGWTHLAVEWRELSPEQQRALSLADNRTAELAEWDQQILETLLAEMEQDSPDLYAALLLDQLREEAAKGEGRRRKAEGTPEVYQVVVYCRDAEDQEAVHAAAIADGRKALKRTLVDKSDSLPIDSEP